MSDDLDVRAASAVGSSPPAPQRLHRRRSVPRRAFNIAVSAAIVTAAVGTAPKLLIGLTTAGLIAGSVEYLLPLIGDRRAVGDWVTDLTHAIGNRALIIPLVTVIVAACGPAVSRLGPQSLRVALGQWPWPARLALIVVVTDLANYLIHRLLHRAPVLWAFHAVHHSSSRLDWLATARGHPIDQAINISAIALPTYALGAARWAPWLITFLFLYPFLLHADIRLRLPYVDLLFVTPAFHRWHHGADLEAHDRNFGAILSVWDRLFGTFIASDSSPERYGLDDGTLAASDYVGQLISPLSTAAAALRHHG